MSQVQRDISEPADLAGTGSSSEDLRRHPRTVHGPVEVIRVRRLPPGIKLSVPRGLRRQRKAVPRDYLFAACIQDQVPRELLYAER